MNYYQLFQIEEDASRKEIEKAYTKKIKEYYEDVETYVTFIVAYEILSDRAKRIEYNLRLSLSAPPSKFEEQKWLIYSLGVGVAIILLIVLMGSQVTSNWVDKTNSGIVLKRP